MQQSDVKNIANEVYRLTDAKLFALAFVRLRLLLKDLQEWWAIQRCEELETLCAQMLRYSLGDYEDPQREVIIAKLQADIYLLVDDVIEAIGIKSFVGYDYVQMKSIDKVRLYKLLTEPSEFLISDSQYLILNSLALDDVFRNVWLSKRLSVEERNNIIAFIENYIYFIIVKTYKIHYAA